MHCYQLQSPCFPLFAQNLLTFQHQVCTLWTISPHFPHPTGPGNHFSTLFPFSRQVVSESCDPVDCSPPGSSVHGILQARILEWVAISFSRRSSWPGVEPGSSAMQAVSLPFEPPGKPLDEQVFENKYPNWSACCLALLPMLSTLFLGK